MHQIRLALLLAITAFLASCFFTDQKGKPTKEAASPPVEETGSPDGTVYLDTGTVRGHYGTLDGRDEQVPDPLDVGYLDAGRRDAGGSEPSKVVCDAEDQVYTSDPKTANKSFVTFISDTITRHVTVDPQDVGRTDHVFLKGVEIEVIEGNGLGFVEWIRVYITDEVLGRTLIAWGADLPGNTRTVQLDVDGTVDVRDELVNGTQLKIEVRGSAPSVKTRVVAHLTFVKLKNCRWE